MTNFAPAEVPAVISFVVGLFYAAGGIVHMRSLVMDRMIDDFLAALGDQDAGKERLRTHIMSAGAALTFASGLSLMAMSRWALPIFAVNAALQGSYLVWAARHFPPQDEQEQAGRSSTVHAFLLYLPALFLVAGLYWSGSLRTWLEPAILELALFSTAAIVALWFFRPGAKNFGNKGTGLVQDIPDEAEEQPFTPPTRLRLLPEFHCSPLWDDERGNMLDVERLGLSAPLVARIEAWNEEFQATFREDDVSRPHFESVDAERAWVKNGYAIAGELAQEWRGPLTIAISNLDNLIFDARYGLDPWTAIPDDRIAWIAERCGVAEVEAAIVRLDELSREMDALPEWDGDTSDDIFRVQELRRRIIASMPFRYVEDIAAGLESPEWRTRTQIALALAERPAEAVLPILRKALAGEPDDSVRTILAMVIGRMEGEQT